MSVCVECGAEMDRFEAEDFLECSRCRGEGAERQVPRITDEEETSGDIRWELVEDNED